MNEKTADLLYAFVNKDVQDFKKDNLNKQVTEDILKRFLTEACSFCQAKFIITQDDIDAARKRIFADFPVYDNPGVLLSSEQDDWFTKLTDNKHLFIDRYKSYLKDVKKFAYETITNLCDKVLPVITNQLGNPRLSMAFHKKGLIIGNIQSGKTSNYIGLICNAADAGYKVIILLSGTIENLRKQTQGRIDEGFIGYDKKENKKVGVANFSPSEPTPISMTSFTNDFIAKTDGNSFNNSIEDSNLPLIFVVKKNVKILGRLFDYLQGARKTGQKEINAPMLLIDDEADNASINTNISDIDPTKTNGWIRNIISLFKQSSYVGYTATPFANVFILPTSIDEMKNDEDLFPKDFIYYLDVPKADPVSGFNSAHYIGPELVFENEFGATGIPNDTMDMIQVIDDDDQTIFPIKHKKDVEIGSLFVSFYDSIREFFLANSIRDLRKDVKEHRTMLINMSPFINVQREIAKIVTDYCDELKYAIKNSAFLSYEQCMSNKIMQDLYQTWKRQFEGKRDCFSWKEILDQLEPAVKDIQVKIVNSANKNTLNYDEYEKNGKSLRVIAVGGLALSRGLTLSGLMTSYFYRNTKTYDVLMQMGRWFGYRPGYADICRLWITDASCDWYDNITQTVAKLRDDIIAMDNSLDPNGKKWTPMSFGIRVWYASNELGVNGKRVGITAPNKSRNVEERTLNDSYFGIISETRYFSTDINDNFAIEKPLEKFVKESHSTPTKIGSRELFGLRNVPSGLVKSFLSSIEPYIDLKNNQTGFDVQKIIHFLNTKSDDQTLYSFDVGFYGGKSEKVISIPGTDAQIHPIQAGFDCKNGLIRLHGRNTRLGSKTDTAIFLSKEVDLSDYQDEKFEGGVSETYFLKLRDRPLLMVYFVELKDSLLHRCDEQNLLNSQSERDNKTALDFFEKMKDKILIGLAVAFQDDGLPHHQESYLVNKGAPYNEADHIASQEIEAPDEIDDNEEDK